MGVSDLLRELRLLKGQQGYRYCMAWLVVLTHILVRPALLFLILLVIHRSNDETTIGKVISVLWSAVGHALTQYMQFP